ncbi:MAG: OmpA family protein [Cyclobacteriaceae bacterium]|nr:OmpA family protein [Cyclobacteriaceae bacterium]
MANPFKINCLWLLLFFFCYSGTWAQDKTKLGPEINTGTFTEYAPTISSDGKTMIFQSDRDGKYNLYSSKLNSGKWSEPEPLEKINAFRDSLSLIGGPSISYDGNSLYFFASDKGTNTEDIFISKREGNGWGDPEPIGPPINTSGYEGFPSISADGKTLYFTRKNNTGLTEGETCYSIYKAEKGRDGKWQEPLELPAPINLGCERAPRIMSDGKTLIFSSIREGGMGNFDLYMTQLRENLEWTEPINMDFVNSLVKDQFGAVSASGEYLYINIEEGSHDIYYFAIPERFRQNKNKIIQGYVTHKYTNAPISATLTILDANTTEEFFTAVTNPADGWYSIVLTEGKKYDIKVSAPGHSDYQFSYDLTSIDQYEEITKNIQLFSHANVHVNVYDKAKLTLTDANLKVKDAVSGRELSSLNTRATGGQAVLKLPIDGKYTIEASEETYIGNSFPFDLTSWVIYEDFEQDVEIDPIMLDYKFIVRDKDTQEGINADIMLLDRYNELTTIRANDGANGNYTKRLRDEHRYEVEVHVPGKAYFSYTNNILASSKSGNNQLIIELEEIKPNLTFTLRAINFETASAELLETSFRELGKVIKLMREYPGISVEISAHTDSDGSDKYNLTLSDARAQSVVDYLIQYGIDTGRLTPKGYGETAPMAPNDTDENKALNRRVEMKILKIDVN